MRKSWLQFTWKGPRTCQSSVIFRSPFHTDKMYSTQRERSYLKRLVMARKAISVIRRSCDSSADREESWNVVRVGRFATWLILQLFSLMSQCTRVFGSQVSYLWLHSSQLTEHICQLGISGNKLAIPYCLLRGNIVEKE